MDENTTLTPNTPEADQAISQEHQENIQEPFLEADANTSDVNEDASESAENQEEAQNPDDTADEEEDPFESFSMPFSINDADEDADIENLDPNAEEEDSEEALDEEASTEDLSDIEEPANIGGASKESRKRQLARRRQQNDATKEQIQENIQRASVWAKLLQAKRENTILTGTMVSTRVFPGPKGEKVEYGIIRYGDAFPLRIMIPFSDFFTQYPISQDEIDTTARGRNNLLLRQNLILMKMVHAPVPFLVKAMEMDDSGNYMVMASRKEALERQIKENFNIDKHGNAVIMENDLVPATVLSVGNHAIFANVGGLDMRIPVRNLSFRYLPNHQVIAQRYPVGSSFPVMIREIQRKDDGSIACVVSGRRAELEYVKRSGIRMQPGETALGTITFVRTRDEGRSTSVFLILEDIGNIPAMSSSMAVDQFGNLPREGDKVRVRFQHYNEDTGITYVRIMRIHESSRLVY